MKKNNYSKILLLLSLFIFTNISAQTDLAPVLLSPPDNSEHVRTIKVILQWIKVPDFDTYQAQISTDESFQPEFIVADIVRSNNAVTAPELENLTVYYWRVRADGSNPWSDTFTFTTTGFAVPVTLVQPPDGAINVDDNTVFSWSSDPVNFDYNLQFSRDPEFLDTLRNINTDKVDQKVNGLPRGSSLYWRVKSFNSDEIPADFSEVFSLRTRLFTPRLNSPGNFTNNSDTAVTFRWNPVDRASVYYFELAIDESFGESSIVLRSESTSTRLTVDSLNTGQIYFWRVLATNAFGDSSRWAAPYRFKTRLPEPVPIFPINQQINLGNKIKFTWSETSDTNHYKFQLASDSTFTTILQSNIIYDTVVTISSLENNNYYFWRVNSRNNVGDTSKWSDVNQFKTRLARPVILFPYDSSNVSPINLTAAWTEIEDAEYYNLELSGTDDFNANIIDTVISESGFVIDSLELNRSYALRLKAGNSRMDTSIYSDTVNFNTSNFYAQPAVIDTVINFSAARSERVAQLKLYNPTNSQMVMNSIIAEPADTFATDKSSLTLPALSSDTINLFIDPAVIDTGFFYGSLKIISIDNETSTFPINIYSKFSTASLSIDSLEADSTLNDDSSTEKFYLSNPGGNIALQILDYRFSEGDVNSFKVIEEIERVSPQDSAGINIIFKPSRAGKNRANLVMVTNSYPDSIVTLPLTGYGTGNFAPMLSDTVKFDTTRSASSNVSEFYLRNFNGHLELKMSSFTITGRDSIAFELIDEPTNIDPQDSVRIRIRFMPSALELNEARLLINTNSPFDSVVALTLTGFGTGGLLSESTLDALATISDSSFETLTANNIDLTFSNTGDKPIEIEADFLNDYFRITNEDPQPFTIPPADSLIITLQYITPNFDSLNTDSLKIYHDGFHTNPLTYYLEGGFESAATSKAITEDLYVNGEKFTGEDYVIGENTSIRAFVDNELLNDKENLDLRINYFIGGPGKKISSVESSTGEYIIPFDDVGSSGLIFKGELFTKGRNYHKTDSVIIFDYVDVQVVLENFNTTGIDIVNSVPASNPADAEANWVFIGFPFEEVIFDSVFSFFGGSGQMQDGEWMVYEYDEQTDNYFSPVSTTVLEPLKGYFFAQSIIESYSLSYPYENAVATRKLNDNVMLLDGDGWKTISNPYTFDVEVNSPAVLYKYDTNNKSYRLTSIMRSGEGYFVSPDVNSLSLKTYGEYYPDLFPKLIRDIGWHVALNISSGRKTEELLISSAPLAELSKQNNGTSITFDKAPELSTEFEAYIFENEGDKKYQAVIGSNDAGNLWEVHVKSLRDNNEIVIKGTLLGELPLTTNYAIWAGGESVTNGEFRVMLDRNETYMFKMIAGSSEYVRSASEELKNNVPEQFSLKQNYPNPFNPSTTIEYSIPVISKDYVAGSKQYQESSYQQPESSTQQPVSSIQPASRSGRNQVSVSLRVYDVLGRQITTLVNEQKLPGSYSVTFDASKLSSGVYYYRLRAGSYVESKKMLLLK